MAKQTSPTVTDLDDESPSTVERKGTATAPASDPEAAVSKPATDNAPKPVRAIISNVRDPMIPFEEDSEKVLPGMPEAKVKDLMRKVPCHVTENFQGRVKTKVGYTSFKFQRHEVVLLPKWFALSHHTRLVIKE